MAQKPFPTVQTFHVAWLAEFEAATPQEAAGMARDQLRSMDEPEAFPPVFHVSGPDGEAVTIDTTDKGGAITIRHTRSQGTLIEGSSKGDGVYDVVHRHGFRYFRSINRLGLPRSRDRAARHAVIDGAAEDLRSAGYAVTVEVQEDVRRTFTAAEEERRRRAAVRAGRSQAAANRAQAKSEELWAEANRRRASIPPGQPLLIDHPSYSRELKFRERTFAMEGQAVAEGERAAQLSHRAEAAANYTSRREAVGTTRRRRERLEAELRQVLRRIETAHAEAPSREDPAELERRAAEIREELTHWHQVLEDAEAAGRKVWTRDDFAAGDFAHVCGRWYEVLKVNARSLTLPPGPVDSRRVVTRADAAPGRSSSRVTYDQITGRRTADAMTAAPAEADV
ncbi:DUF3560 domain-containing protein [Streptomyces sp. NPDC002835]